LPSVRLVVFGGEALEPSRVSGWVVEGGPRLVNMYGITETTVHVTYRPLSEEIIESGHGSLIGRAIPDLGTYLVDQNMQFAPIGVPGEIHVSGAGVTRGYLNQPGLTAARFIPDPFSTGPSSRMYRSGDLGRWGMDRSIEYIGRNDHQVKIRGFRIELGEIEEQLSRHPSVKEAVVLARGDQRDEKRLVAYVTLEGPMAEASTPLRAHLRKALPEYMVPSVIIVLDRMPLTSNGKLDRKSLPPPAEVSTDDRYIHPEGMVEQTVAESWRELLGLGRVGALDNFFELGGHSLLVVKALFKINQVLGCSLTVTDVYRSPTVRELSARILGGMARDALVDLAQEAVLDETIIPHTRSPRIPERAVLLTGATGFVGRFLLSQLLTETAATIHCLVRARSAPQAFSRLKQSLLKWDLWEEGFESRIVAIAGDLRAPRLGIDAVTHERLARDIDSIYHCATSMNHLETYSMAKPANVQSITELLRLATTTKSKLINYVSTLSIFGSTEGGVRRVIDEHSSIDGEKHSASNGYAASKWVAEKIFMIARERGIPCNIFRLGLVWADTEMGRYDELQREYRIFKSALLSGCGIQDYRYQLPPTPVDYVARAVLFLSKQHPLGNRIFHLSSSRLMEEGVFERCNRMARTSLDLKPLYDWIGEIKRRYQSGQSLPVVPLVEYAFSMDESAFLERHPGNRVMNTEFDCSRTQRELEEAGIVAPTLSDEWLGVFVDRLVKTDVECTESVRRPGGEVSRTADSLKEDC
jgi:thioester reductase-like protein